MATTVFRLTDLRPYFEGLNKQKEVPSFTGTAQPTPMPQSEPVYRDMNDGGESTAYRESLRSIVNPDGRKYSGVPESYGSMFSNAGTAAGMLTGMTGLGALGLLAGTGVDQYNVNQELAKRNAPTLGFGNYLEALAAEVSPNWKGQDIFGLETPGQQALGVLDQMGWWDSDYADDMAVGRSLNDAMGYTDYLSSEDEAIGWDGSYGNDYEHSGGGDSYGGEGGWGSESDFDRDVGYGEHGNESYGDGSGSWGGDDGGWGDDDDGGDW